MKYRSSFILWLSLVVTTLLVDACNNNPSSPTSNGPITNISSPSNGGSVVTTLAGSAGVTGATNATGTAATFALPFEVAVDTSGNVYVADYLNDMIRKVTSVGVVSTFATSVSPVNPASLILPLAAAFGVAVDTSGILYIGNSNENLINEITSGGTVSTLAGTAYVSGDANGTGTAATFGLPLGIAVDTSGNVYVADQYNNMIRKITSGGVVSTLAGGGPMSIGSTNGTGTSASFYYPDGVAVDASGSVYVADTQNNMIRKISSGGVVTTLAGSTTQGSTNGTGVAASFFSPKGVAVDSSDNVYVADSGNDLIRKISSAGEVSTLAGSAGVTGATNGSGTSALFNNPTGVAVDTSGNVYVADYNNDLIRKIH